MEKLINFFRTNDFAKYLHRAHDIVGYALGNVTTI